ADVRVEIPELRHLGEAIIERCHAWVWGWNPDFPDPDAFLRSLLAHLPVLGGDELTELLEHARSLHDQDARLEVYREVDRLLVSERVAVVPLHYDRGLLVRRPWISGHVPHPLIVASPIDWIVVDEERRRQTRAASRLSST